jgi:uncharacterized protein YbcI
MPDTPPVPAPPAEVPQGQSLLATISREMVTAMKVYYGRGPTQAKSYFLDDLLFVVMRGGVTEVEQTMLEAGEEDVVRAFRQRFENVMARRLRGTIEQLTARVVVNYQSQVLFDPDLTIVMFIFDKPMGANGHKETARVLLEHEAAAAEVLSNEEEGPPTSSA